MALGTLATLTSRFSVVRFSGVAQEEAGGLLGGLAVVVLQDVCARLQEEADVGVADAFADDLRLMPARSAPVA
jgi:hypothetical protein